MIETINPATERLFGYSAAELLGRNVKMLMPQPFAGEHDGYIESYLNTGNAKIIGIGREVSAMRKDGTIFPMSLSVSEMPLGEKRMFTGIIHDLTGRRQLERQLLEASANEQRRIGQDLHDGLCQDLIGIAFAAETVSRHLEKISGEEAAAVNRLAMSVREVAAQARRLSHGLNPVDLNIGGLPIALEGLAEKISSSFQITCSFEWDGKANVSDNTGAVHLYRITQEAISNALKHGKARNVRIHLEEMGGRLLLRIEDDGVGMSPKTNEIPYPISEGSNASASGIGMAGMRYRTNLVGGILAIGPARPHGTVVACSIPILQRSKARPKRDAAMRAVSSTRSNWQRGK